MFQKILHRHFHTCVEMPAGIEGHVAPAGPAGAFASERTRGESLYYVANKDAHALVWWGGIQIGMKYDVSMDRDTKNATSYIKPDFSAQ